MGSGAGKKYQAKVAEEHAPQIKLVAPKVFTTQQVDIDGDPTSPYSPLARDWSSCDDFGKSDSVDVSDVL